MRYGSEKGYDFGKVTDRILKCPVEVHKQLGPHFMEVTYHRSLGYELLAEGLEFDRECWVDVFYKGKEVDKKRVDFVIEDVIVEIKAKSEFEKKDYIQTLCYLKATKYKVALPINFGAKRIQVKRLLYTQKVED